MSLNIVYYSGFWYSSHSIIGRDAYGALLNQAKKLQRIKDDMRLLSLVFDKIHIPRSHLLTFQTNAHWEIASQYIKSDDYKYFSTNKVILSSQLPYLDSESDTDRIIARVFDNNWSGDIDKSYINTIKSQESAKIDSGTESIRNVDIFQQYIEFHKTKNNKLGKRLEEIKKRSNYKDIPFLHEMFIEDILTDNILDSEQKEQVWRETNSMYITTGCLDLEDSRKISYDKNIEALSAAHDNEGTLRSLYSPSFIESMIREELGTNFLAKFLNGDIEKVSSFRSEGSELFSIWTQFRSELSFMFDGMTLLEKYEPQFSRCTDSQIISMYKSHLLTENGTAIADIVAGMISGIASEVDPIAGKAMSGGKRVISKKISKWLENRSLAKTIGGYQQFWNSYKPILKGI